MKALSILHPVLVCTFLAPFITTSPLGGLSDSFVLNDRRLSTTTTPSAVLNRRGSQHIGGGWWMYYDTFNYILPWKDAAEGMDTFFQAISDRANGVWKSQTPQNYLEVVQGDLKLEFFADLQPISWFFIARFADRMRRALELGFTGVFDMRIVAPTGVVVYVHFRVGQALAAAAA